MSQLSAQSIRALCQTGPYAPRAYWHQGPDGPLPLISPFLNGREIIGGRSAGLSAASYDIRIAHDLELGPHPGFLLRDTVVEYADHGPYPRWIETLAERLACTKPNFALAHSIENFALPNNVAGYVCDKSTYARMHVSAFNTLFDPGFRGNATLELVNLSDDTVLIKAGDPICQLVFHWLDEPTVMPYRGKYQDQPYAAVPAILEQSETPT